MIEQVCMVVETLFAALALGAVATGLLSAFVYLCGLVVGWIYQELRRAR